MKNFQISRLQPFEMINELFTDTVVICHHEKLFTSLSKQKSINHQQISHKRTYVRKYKI